MEEKETKKIQWHPGFATGIYLELGGYRSGMVEEREYNLNTKPLEIDVLLRKETETKSTAIKTEIKAETGTGKGTEIKTEIETKIGTGIETEITETETETATGLMVTGNGSMDNEIARIFRRYNIVEYKSPEAHLDINTYFKAHSYACLLKVYGHQGKTVDETDITISFVRHAKPKQLLAHLKKMGMEILNPNPGIYYIMGKTLFPIQVVVTRELDLEKHTWLVALSGRLKKEQIRRILEKAGNLKDKRDRELADSVLQVCIAANRKIVEELKGEKRMCQALREIMKPELEQSWNEGIEKGIERGIEKGIDITVKILRGLGQSDENIKKSIMENYTLSQEAAEKYMVG